MVKIKRTKSLPPGPMDAIIGRAPPAVHWALALDPAGDVAGWTTDRAQAGQFDGEAAEKTVARYASRPAVGQLTLEQVDEKDKPLVGRAPNEEDFSDALFEIRRLREENDRLRRQLEEATAPVAEVPQAPSVFPEASVEAEPVPDPKPEPKSRRGHRE